MDNTKLIQFTGATRDISAAEITARTNGAGDRYISYVDKEAADKAYDGIRSKLKNWMLADNLVVLCGAGASITTGLSGKNLDDKELKYTGKTVGHIWSECKKKIDAADVAKLQTILKEEDEDFQLERFISKLDTFVSANQHSTDASLIDTVAKCVEVKATIIEILKAECGLVLHETAPHEKFLRNILTSRKRSQKRMQLYTLNYDTLFEQAAQEINATIIDGFSFNRTPTFNGSNYDLDVVKREHHRVHHEENYEEKVFQLFKLHGSLDWRELKDEEGADEDTRVIRVQDIDAPGTTVFIPPSAQKYEQSYAMPYFEMMSRFQQTMRRESTVLLVVGYSFSDAHINRVILEALASNLNFEIVVVSPGVGASNQIGVPKLLQEKIAKKRTGITLISDTFQGFVEAMPILATDLDNENSEENPVVSKDPEPKIGG
jgi:NAD-dependent SIR2 family protein deacetylase